MAWMNGSMASYGVDERLIHATDLTALSISANGIIQYTTAQRLWVYSRNRSSRANNRYGYRNYVYYRSLHTN